MVKEEGYGGGDPRFLEDVGYRSGLVANVGAGTGTFRSHVKYNDFEFPANCKVSATIVHEYDDLRRTVKYITLAITVEAVITRVDSTTTSKGGSFGTDEVMDYIRSRLSRTGQALTVQSKGLGTIKVNHYTGDGFKDIDFGPKPQVIEMKPIAGAKAVNLTWLVTTRIPQCTQANSLNGIVQSYYSMSWNTTFEGITVRTIKGKIEQTQSRKSQSGQANAENLVNRPQAAFDELARIVKLFPPIGGYKRNINYELSADKKMLSFTFTDAQFPHSIPLFPTVVAADISQELSSSVQEGFFKWDLKISGNIQVGKPSDMVNSVNDLKKEAWTWLGIFIQERLDRVKDKRFLLGEGTKDVESKYCYHLPVKISIKDNIYANTFSFSFQWWLFATTDVLLAATGFLDAPDINGLTWEKNIESLEEMRVFQRADLPIPINAIPQDYVIDLCNPVDTGESPASSEETPKKGFAAVLKPELPPKESSFAEYHNDFTMIIDNDTYYAVAMDDDQRPIQEVKIPFVVPHEAGYLPYDHGVGPDTDAKPGNDDNDKKNPDNKSLTTKKQVVQKPNRSTYKVTMTGYGIRVGYAMGSPRLESYGDRKAYKTGQDIVSDRKLSIGVAMLDSEGETKIATLFRTDWEKSYILDGIPGVLDDGGYVKVVSQKDRRGKEGKDESPANTDGHPEIIR